MATKCTCPPKRSRRGVRNPNVPWIDLPEILGDRLRRVGGDGSYLVYIGSAWQDRHTKVVVIGNGPHAAGPSGRYVGWKALVEGAEGRYGQKNRYGDVVVAVENVDQAFGAGNRRDWEDTVRRNLYAEGLSLVDTQWGESPTLKYLADYWAAI